MKSYLKAPLHSKTIFTKTIEDLIKFKHLKKTDPIINNYISIEALIEMQEQLSKIDKDLNNSIMEYQEAINKLVLRLREQLIPLLSWEETKIYSLSLADVAYDGLIVLAKYQPLNSTDPISKKLPVRDQIFVTTGHQFSLINLVWFHNSRKSNSIDNLKYLTNPFTGLRFDQKDALYIIKCASKLKLTIQDLILDEDDSQEECQSEILSHDTRSSVSSDDDGYDDGEIVWDPVREWVEFDSQGKVSNIHNINSEETKQKSDFNQQSKVSFFSSDARTQDSLTIERVSNNC